MIPPIRSHITFEAADVELQMAAHNLTAGAAVLAWATVGLPKSIARRRLNIKAVRIIGTCAVCGARGEVVPCNECDRDVAPPCLVERGADTICRECA